MDGSEALDWMGMAPPAVNGAHFAKPHPQQQDDTCPLNPMASHNSIEDKNPSVIHWIYFYDCSECERTLAGA